MAASPLHNRRIGPFILSVGLRKDGGRDVRVLSDYRDGGPVIFTLITPGPIVMLFHRATIDALNEQIDYAENHCYECGIALDADEGTILDLDFFVFDEIGAESMESRPTRLCDEDAAHFSVTA